MGRRSELVEKHTVRVGRANKSEFKVACVHCRSAGIETQFVSRTDAVVRHLNQCQVYDGPLPTLMVAERDGNNLFSSSSYHHNQQQQRPKQRPLQMQQQQQHNNNVNHNNNGLDDLRLPPVKRMRNEDNSKWIQQMEKQVLRAMVSMGMPFSAVEDEAFRQLLQTLNPLLEENPSLIPTRGALAGRILMEADRGLKADSLEEIGSSKWVTLTVDCWVNCTGRSILGYVLRLTTGRSIAWEWRDVTDNGTGSLKNGVWNVAQHPDIASKVAGVVVTESGRNAFANSDESGSVDQILTLACYDQEVRSMFGDCLLALPGMKDALRLASEVTKLFRDTTDGRSALIQAKQDMMTGLGQEDDFSFQDDPLRNLLQYNSIFVRALYIMENTQHKKPVLNSALTISDGQFSALIHVACEILGALNEYTQSSEVGGGPKLRMVLPAAFQLWNTLEEATHVAGTNDVAIQEAKYVLNKRLQSWDSRLLVLAVIFDPALKRSIFNPNFITTPLAISLCEEAYRRFFSEEPSQALIASFLQYLQDDSWPFSDHKYDTVAVDSFYWSPLVKGDHPELARLALRLESCIVDPVDPEKLFDDMGRVHAALRSKNSSQPGRVDLGNKDPECLSDFVLHHESSYGHCGSGGNGSIANEFTFESLFANTSLSTTLLGHDEDLASYS